MTYNTPLPISGRDPDSVPLEERIAELEEAKRDPMKAIRATRERRNREELERGREDLKEAWLASGANLSDAIVSKEEQLEQQALSLEGATMPSGHKYEH